MLTRPARLVLALVVLLAACAAPPRPVGLAAPEVRITLLQLNDLYVLEPVDEGRRGGLARLATLVKRIRGENPATLLTLAGDLISPSAA
ncbi:MAG TPA: bifunctional metallophosphatase/5'-nucleotidase, partial [Methylomirabilota bacterium]|nr:bifunctional metallophosphatase/5'-nucleotidase [Methylomirabilota bacterium]